MTLVASARRSQTSSPSWDKLAEFDDMSFHSATSSGRSTPTTTSKSTFAERMCAGPFARGRMSHRNKRKQKQPFALTSHFEEADQSGAEPVVAKAAA